MPRTISADGRTIVVPDDATDEEINQIVGPAPKTASPPDTRNAIQKSFDSNTTTSPSEPLLQTGLKSVVGAIGAPFIHPLGTLKAVAQTAAYALNPASSYASPDNPLMKMAQSSGKDYQEGGTKYAATKAAGQTFGGVALGEAAGPVLRTAAPAIEQAISDTASAAKTAAIGDTNAAVLRGLRIPANSPKTLPILGSVDKARPYLAGADSLADLQAKVPTAKAEIWSPYQQTIDAMGKTPVKGPDGITTIGDLEQERLQLSALNRGLKQGSPDAIQLAQQKGMSAAELLDREKAVTSALDPELSKYGIDPQGIRQNFGAVSRIGQQIGGKSTLLEKPQPFGLGKMADIKLDRPSSWLGQPISGVRDLIAGRPLLKGSPTDIGIKEGFGGDYTKPNLGTFQPPNIKGLLGTPVEDIPLHNPFSEPVSPKLSFDAPVLPGRYPAGGPPANYFRFGDQPLEIPEGATGINQQGVLRRRK